MNCNYGNFEEKLGTYVLTKIPEAGNFEFLLKNKNIFLKVDQFGPALIQIEPPAGMKVLIREERETFSPYKLYFYNKNKLVHNFDIYSTKSFKITYSPTLITYELIFTDFKVTTFLYIDSKKADVHMDVKFINLTGKNTSIKCLVNAELDLIDTSMAIWDKKEWYMTTECDEINKPIFTSNHYSVDGKVEDRRCVQLGFNKDCLSYSCSSEYVKNVTKGFSIIPMTLFKEGISKVSIYEQGMSAIFDLNCVEECEIKSVISINDKKIDKQEILKKMDEAYIQNTLKETSLDIANLYKIRQVETKDERFNHFVNGFLPLELSWVEDLDRGWTTGMRGARDCANDFLGLLAYDKNKCKEVIANLFSNQRFEDGWYPRQIPFGESKKYDMRPFADSNCFVMELVYEYLTTTNDFSIIDEMFPYLNSKEKGTGLEHILKTVDYYCLDENIGEHGLVKLHGGDWLDCLNKVGLEGRGETVMVTMQAILAFNQVIDILNKFDKENKNIDKYEKYISLFKKNIKKHAYLEDEGFYKGLFSDDGNWYFSNKDKDGYKRVYVPTNAYSIISEIDKKKDKQVIKTIVKNNETPLGFKLFTYPFGMTPIEGIGKMGTGDFRPYMLENGSVYNHGANLFFLRALAKAGDYKTLYRTLNYVLPCNYKVHPENKSFLPSYALTNCYNLAESFYGRGSLSFLTGSIAMVERSIYNWMFGICYGLDDVKIKPCLPKEYSDSRIIEHFNDKEIEIKYNGFGNKVTNCIFNGNKLAINDGFVSFPKTELKDNNEIIIDLD